MIEQRLSEWLELIAGMDVSRPTQKQLQQLRNANAVAQSAQQWTDLLSINAIRQAAELSRILEDKIRQAAATVGFNIADQSLFFAADYESRANAWEALQAGVWNLNRKPI